MRLARPRWWRQWTLRSRMVVTVVGLAAIALLISNLVGVTVLQHYLVQRANSDVEIQGQFLGRAGGPGGFGRPRPDPSALPTPRPTSDPQVLPGGDSRIFYTYDAEGNLHIPPRGSVEFSDGPHLGSFDDVKARAGAGTFTASSADGAEDFRVRVTALPDGDYAVSAVSLARVEMTTNQMLGIGLAVSLFVLLGLGFAAYSVVRIGLRPLTAMEEAAAEISHGDLTVRVPDTDPHTEPGRLGLALNAMLGRVEGAVAARTASEQRLRQFLADASHELRTPLTSIRGFAELYRRGGARPGPELDETMSRIEDEAARMGLLVEDLLMLADLDEERPLQRSRVDLLEVAVDTVRDAHVRSPGRIVELAGFEPVGIRGDEHRIRQVLTNLVANALQHTPADARITVRVTSRGGDDADRFELPVHREAAPVVAAVGAALAADAELAVVEISDTGPGVPTEHAERIFERLYRADPHRARSHGGAGLGLAIASAIVKAHGGRIELATAQGAGATFRVLIPLA